MTAAEWQGLSPLLIAAATSLVAVLLATVRGRAGRPRPGLATGLTAVGLTLAAGATVAAADVAPLALPLFAVDGTGLYFGALLFAAAAVAALFAGEERTEHPEELCVLLALGVTGAVALAWSTHLASLFLGLETLGVALYGLIAFRRDEPGIEAALKYLVQAAAAAAFLLFGSALVYAERGTLELGALALGDGSPLLVAGIALLAIGVAFKLALVPFHLWAADVYQGAPASVTAFVATVSKGAAVALLLRIVAEIGVTGPVATSLAAVAGVSMLAGNVLALLQDDLRRLLAYSSIAHFGYLLVALLAGVDRGPQAAAFYFGAYVVTTLVAFGVVAVLEEPGKGTLTVDACRGLLWRRPALATALGVSLLSLTGIPLTAGFPGKLALLLAGVEGGRLVLVGCLVLGSAIGAYPYLRVVAALIAPAPEAETRRPIARAIAAALGLLVAVVVGIGVYPGPWLGWVAAWVGR